jgi:hypothetical protein
LEKRYSVQKQHDSGNGWRDLKTEGLGQNAGAEAEMVLGEGGLKKVDGAMNRRFPWERDA